MRIRFDASYALGKLRICCYDAGAMRDDIYQKHLPPSDFKFDEKVVRVFPDMIARSVPSYDETLLGIARFTRRYAQAGSYVYDLGCSLGAATLAMRQNISVSDCRVVGVDRSSAMVERCQAIVAQDNSKTPILIEEGDVLRYPLKPASVIVSNFTLQFIDPQARADVVQKIYDALLPGGVFILSEKIRLEDEALNAWMVELHHDFKRSQGYSDLEISQKRSALEQVMHLDSLKIQGKRLGGAGFRRQFTWLKHMNFCSTIAQK